MNIVDCFGTDGAELYIFFLSVSAPSVPNYIYIYIYQEGGGGGGANDDDDGKRWKKPWKNDGKTTTETILLSIFFRRSSVNREHSPHFTWGAAAPQTPRARLRRAVHTCGAKTRGRCAKKGRMAAAAAADDDDDEKRW